MTEEMAGLWPELQRRLQRRTFRNWTVANGDLDTQFDVVGVRSDRIEVTSTGIRGAPRKITRSDVENVARLWPDYRERRIKRQAIRDIVELGLHHHPSAPA